MDEKFRQRQRAHRRDPQDIQEALAYIQALEQKLGIRPETKHRMAPDDTNVICLMCEREIENAGWADGHQWVEINTRPDGHREAVMMVNPWQAVSLATRGNYGSQVLDGETLFFFICDGCIIKHSHKMLYRPDSSSDEEDKISNARDHFEEWYAALKKRRMSELAKEVSELSGIDVYAVGDNYMEAIEPYFSEEDNESPRN